MYTSLPHVVNLDDRQDMFNIYTIKKYLAVFLYKNELVMSMIKSG